MSDTEVSRTYIRPDNKFVITCPHCGQQKIILASSLKMHIHKLKVKCYCKKTFMTYLEFRKHIRRKTRLKGHYLYHSQKEMNGILFVEDVSMTGLSFTCYGQKNFNVDDELSITFNLDDDRQTEISKSVIVNNVRKISVGCVFETAERDYSPLGFYINEII